MLTPTGHSTEVLKPTFDFFKSTDFRNAVQICTAVQRFRAEICFPIRRDALGACNSVAPTSESSRCDMTTDSGATRHDMPIQVRMRQPLVQAIEDWRRSHSKIPTRSDAIRTLIE